MNNATNLVQTPLYYFKRHLWGKRSMNLKTPISLVFFVTNKCNLKCEHCFYSKGLNRRINELSLPEIKKIALSLRHPLQMLCLTGGEPILRNDLVDICYVFKKYNKTKNFLIPTNGFDYEGVVNTIKDIQSILRSRLEVQVSIDGFERTHDRIRRKGSFNNAIKTISEIKKLKDVSTSIMTTVSETNYKEISKLIKYFKKYGIKHKFQFLRSSLEVYTIDKRILSHLRHGLKLPAISDLEKTNLIIDAEEKDMAQKLKRRISLQVLVSRKRVFNCKAGIVDAVLYPNGDVSLCELTKPIGNIRDYHFDFYRLWHSKQAYRLRSELQHCTCIHSCNILSSLHYPKAKLVM